jgi:TetR/AcrR family transcriptional repressor of mexJK operon
MSSATLDFVPASNSPARSNAQSAGNAPAGARADRNRLAIIAAARQTFLAEGYDASVDTIAASAGVSKVTLYNHFGSKEGLFIAVIGEALDHALGQLVAEAKQRASEQDDPKRALTRATQALVEGVTEPDVLALRNLVTGELRRFPQLGSAWGKAGPGRAATMLTALLDNLIDQGSLSVPHTDVAVVQLLALTLYPHLVANSYGATVPPGLNHRLINSGLAMFLEHYAPKRAGIDDAADGSARR